MIFGSTALVRSPSATRSVRPVCHPPLRSASSATGDDNGAGDLVANVDDGDRIFLCPHLAVRDDPGIAGIFADQKLD